ncbi:gluconokinase [Nitratireductor sp. XY-223]|uniref:gluconokinase n=1 Tax=Nitratireductor sp. XY-223 TaxID=2561926 RepID=UPI0010AA1496|nr:gluconokinase [Nitratireductor sp. XY-223]
MSTAESRPVSDTARLYVVMGVAGCGKSSVGAAVARKFGATYLDGDDFHPPRNIDKMSRGEALTDDDRWPWLKIVAREMAARPGKVFAGCSALRRIYRDTIAEVAGEPVTFVFLDGTRDLIAERMNAREGHFMPLSLLDSQFAALEKPEPDERAIVVDISKDQAQVVEDICAQIGKDGP